MKGNGKTSLANGIQPLIWVGISYLKICRESGTSRKSPWQRITWCNSLSAFLQYGGDSFAEEIGLIISGMGSSKTRFQYCQNSCNTLLCIRGKEKLEEIWSNLNWWVLSLFFSLETLLFHANLPYGDSSLVGGKAKKSDKLYSSLHWIPGEMRLKKHSKVTCQNRERYTAGQSGNTLRTPEGSSKTRFQYCNNSCNDLLCIRTKQGHTGGDVIALELMGNVATLFKRKEFIFNRGCSFNLKSIFHARLIAGGGKQRRDDKLYSSLHWIPGEMKLKKKSKVTCRNRERYTAG